MIKTVVFKIRISLVFVLIFETFSLTAQKTVAVNDSIKQYIFLKNEILCLEDKTGQLNFSQVSDNQYNKKFIPNKIETPQTKNLASTYWFKIKIQYPETLKKYFLLEFFDQTIDELTVYSPNKNGGFDTIKTGDKYIFESRYLKHKNFEIPLENTTNLPQTFYIRVKSCQQSDVIIVLRSVEWFVAYTLKEYFSFGIFYGMILVFGFYNVLMFFAIRQKQYLYYVLYVLSVGLYEMCVDGIAYQYVWGNSPEWNQYAYGVGLYLITLFSLLFTQSLLHTKTKAPFFYKLINAIIVLRTLFFIVTLIFNKSWLIYKPVEIFPFLVCFITGIYCLMKGYKPARFFVLGYSLLFIGLAIKVGIVLLNDLIDFGVLSYYSLSICFILEMTCFSFAVGDRVRILKFKKEQSQKNTIKQISENIKLKDILNQKLEAQVAERTRELSVKSAIIQEQNEELISANILLKQQSEEILRTNILLSNDNVGLQTNIEDIQRARIMAKEVDFQEFSKIYPDKESCYKYLSNLKWQNGYACNKCGNTHYFQGHLPYSRRCNKCSYEESVMTNTFFEHARLDITKAFYLVFLCYSTNGKISSYRLSELLSIRQSTCWAYQSKLKKMMTERKKELKNAGAEGWSNLVMSYE